MADQNPWATGESQGNPWQNNQNQSQNQNQNPYHQQQPNQPGGYPQQRFYNEQETHQQQQQPYQSYQQQQSQSYQQPQGYGSGQDYYNQPSYQQQQPDYNAWSDSTGNPPLPARNPAQNAGQPHGVSRHDTDELLASQEDRSEQVEHLQAYEATANLSVDDRNRAQLEKEFPTVDGSLIAALYGDTKDLSATRELLQELARE